jgi:hypothetical protein
MPRRIAVIIVILNAIPLCGANWPERPQLRAIRVTQAPVIDGRLNEPAWQGTPAFTDFTQHDPEDTKPATLPTSVRIVYDDHAIYFGLNLSDTHAPTALLFRRDTFGPSDFVSINIDPQLDRLSGNAFTLTPSNVQIDTVLYNDIGEDGSWDGVWESATQILPDGWIAEVRVPFSQLRFLDKPVHVWGLNITRRTVRINELVRIVNTPKGQTGFVSHFADIVGLEGIRRGRPLELVPYTMGRSDVRTRIDSGREARADGGLDLKWALTSSLTLTGTINPDFGQVEVDPAVVNLTEFETFYPEKRPFFTEGLNILNFDDTPAPSHFNFFFPPSLFYTRRIGRDDGGSEARILAAAKVTGKLPGGWSIGILDALTDVAGKTNYFVSRGTKELGGDSRIGFMATSVNRRDGLSAVTAGVDGYTGFGSWIAEGSLFGSELSGQASEIAGVQLSSARYYQRPDAAHVRFDPTRTSLDGWGGRAMISKTGGLWRPIVQVQAYSPGYETNDIGFMQRTDIVSSHAVMQYVNLTPTEKFREKNLWFGVWQNQNFDGDVLDRGIFFDWFGETQQYLQPRVALFIVGGDYSDRLTRGGPLTRYTPGWELQFLLETDERKKLSFEVSGSTERAVDGSYGHQLALGLTARPSANLQFEIEPLFRRAYEYVQYVTSFDDPAATATFGRRYLFAGLHQREFDVGIRADWTLSSRLSLQLYMQPFISAGDYDGYRALTAAGTRDYEPYAYSGGDPDFNFRSLRGSVVLRWEFRPGSALYLAWNENRADAAPIGDFRFGRDLRAIPSAPSHDVFLVKLSYWLPM